MLLKRRPPRRARRISRFEPGGLSRFAIRALSIETLERRVVLAGTIPFYDEMGLRFTAVDGFTLSGGTYSTTSGAVEIGYVPRGGQAVKNLLEYEPDPGMASFFSLHATAAQPYFSMTGGDLAITAAGGITPIWKPAPIDKVDIGQLIGSGYAIDQTGILPFRVLAIDLTPTQITLAEPGMDPTAGQVKLQGEATFDDIPIAAKLGLEADVNGTNYVIADASGFSLTGLEATATIPTGKTIGGVEVSGQVTVGYDSATKFFTVGGGVAVTSTDGGFNKPSTLTDVAATLSMTVGNEQVQALSFSIGGQFTFHGVSLITYPGQPLGFSYNLAAQQYEVFGKVQVQSAEKAVTVSVDLGSMAAPGIVIKDGALRSFDATINADFEFKAATIRTDETGGIQIQYDRAADSFDLTGGASLVIAPGSDHPQMIAVSFVAADGGPGLVIQDGKVTSFAVAVSGALNIYGLRLTAIGASVAWDPTADTVALGGTFTADFKVFQTSLTLGTAKSPGILIEHGDFMVRDVHFELDNASLGSVIQIQDLAVTFQSATDTQGNASFNLEVDADVIVAGEFKVGGSFDLVDGRLDSISLSLRDDEGVPIGDTGLLLTAISAQVTNIETPSQIVVTGSMTVVWGEPLTFAGKDLELFRVTGTVTASASELIIDAQAELGAYSTDNGVTYQGLLGSGDAKLTLDWAQHFYSLHVAIDGLAGIFNVEGDIVFSAGQDIAFLATAEVVVPAFVPFIGGLELGGFGFFFDHVFEHQTAGGAVTGGTTTIAGWITLDIIWPFTVGFQVYFDANGNETTSLIGGGQVANYRKEVLPPTNTTFSYMADFTNTVPAAATSLVATVDWSQSNPSAAIQGTPTFQVIKTVPGQAPVTIDEKDFAANGISFIDNPDFSGATRKSVQIVGSAADPYRTLGAQYALKVTFTTDGTNPFPDYPDPNSEDQLKIAAAYHIPVPSFGPTGGPQPYAPGLPSTGPTATFPVTLSGNIDEGLIPRAKVSLYRVAVDDPYQRGVLVGTSALTAVSPPANGINWTATFQIPIDGLDPTHYTLYSVLDDGSSSDPATAAKSNAPIQTGASAAFTPDFAIQGRVANQNGDPEAGWHVFLDYNGNGVQDADEPGGTTNADGYYGFTRTFAAATGWAGVPLNLTFPLHLVLPSGIAEFAAVAPIEATFDGTDTATANFPVREHSAISGVVYVDSKNTGQASDGQGVPGATVYLDFNGNGRLDAGEPTAVTDTTGQYLFGNVAAGAYHVRVQGSSLVDSTAHVAYVVPAGTQGTDAAVGASYGTRFTVRRPVSIGQLGVFDDGSDGLAWTLTAVLYDATTHAELARLTFTPADPGTLVGGSRFKTLAQPVILPAGFVGEIVAYGYGPGERAGNIGTAPGPWTVDGGGNVLTFDSSSYATATDNYPTIPSNPASGSAWAAGTFAFAQLPWTATSPSSDVLSATIAAGGFSLSEGNDFGVLTPAYVAGTITGGATSAGAAGGSTELTAGWSQATVDAARVAASNLGGPAAGLFGADPGATGASPATVTSAPINTSGVVNPAPQAVYQSQVYGTDFTYRVGGLTPNTQYLVRLHYAEIYFNSADQRLFNVAINGTQVLSNFDIVAAAGGEDIALVREFVATADASGTIAVRSFAAVNNAVLNGLEVLRDDAPQAGWTVQLVADTVAQAASNTEARAINPGGPTDGVYGADTGASGGTVGSTADAINTSQVDDPAPQAVYQSYRSGTFTYAATGLTPNTVYTVRLHFVDTQFTAVGQRLFDVSINGVPVLTDFDIVAAAGGKDVAIARTFTAAADASGTIRLAFANNATVSAIEIRQPGGAVAVDAGGGAAGVFAADGGFSGGTPTTPTGVRVDTSPVADPAPQAVYQTGRYGDDFTYTMAGLVPGQAYIVRLHFAETNFKAAGQREFNVAINGVPVLTDFDIIATAGGPDIAVVEPFNASADAGGSIVIRFTKGSADHADISGIEVIQAGTIVATTTTDAQGRYAFVQPTPGAYTVREVAPSGWRQVGGTSTSLSFAATPTPIEVKGALAVADLDGDGQLDYAAADSDGNITSGVTIYLDGGTKTAYFPTQGAGIKIVVGDFNGDHRPDLAILNTNGSSEISILLNTGNSDPSKMFTVDNNFWPGQSLLNNVNLVDMAGGDLNGDGLTDLVVTYATRGNTAQGGYAVFMNGDASTRKVTTYPVTTSQPTGVALGDINGDGKVDLVFGGAYQDPVYESFYVAYGDGRGKFTSPTAFLVNDGAFGGPVALGDVQGLGLNDAAFLSPSAPSDYTVQTVLNSGSGGLRFGTTVVDGVDQPATPVPQRIILADVNGDGRPDLILLDYTRSGYTDGRNGVMVYLNTGRGDFFQASDPHWSPTQPNIPTWDMAVADFNGDGLNDILVSNSASVNEGGTFATLLTNQSLQGQLGTSVRLDAGQFIAGVDFDNVPLPGGASVSGRVYDDANRSGTVQAGEGGIGGLTVFADLNGDGRLDPGEPAAITRPDGSYSLVGLPSGAYRVVLVGADGWVASRPGGDFASLSVGDSALGADFLLARTLLEPVVGVEQVTVGQPLTSSVAPTADGAADGHLWRFSLDPGSPPGAAIDPATGLISWTPAAAPGRYTLTARLRDALDPAQTQAVSIAVDVLEAPPAVAVATTTTLVLPLDPSAPGAPITLSAIVSAANGVVPTGSITFYVSGVGDFVVPLVASGNEALATLVLGPLAPSTRIVFAVYGGDADFAASRSGGVLRVAPPIPLPSPGGPVVTAVEPVQVGAHLTGLTIHFDEPIGPLRAVNIHNYRLRTVRGVPIRILSASYDPITQTVRLAFRPLPAAALGRLILVINGQGAGGIIDLDGHRLDGKQDGKPGHDARITFGHETPRPSAHARAFATPKHPARPHPIAHRPKIVPHRVAVHGGIR